MEWDWMVSARPRPLPLPLGPRPWSPSFFSRLGPLSTFDLTEVIGQETGKPIDMYRICFSIINSLFLHFPAYYVGRECFLQKQNANHNRFSLNIYSAFLSRLLPFSHLPKSGLWIALWVDGQERWQLMVDDLPGLLYRCLGGSAHVDRCCPLILNLPF